MSVTITLVKFEKQQTKEEKDYWDTAFEIVADDYPNQYIPITIYAHELPVKDDDSVISAAAAKALPPHVAAVLGRELKKKQKDG